MNLPKDFSSADARWQRRLFFAELRHWSRLFVEALAIGFLLAAPIWWQILAELLGWKD